MQNIFSKYNLLSIPLIISFFLLTLCYIPFSSFIGNYAVYIELVLLIPFIIRFRNYKLFLKIDFFFVLGITLSFCSLIINRSLLSVQFCFTLLLGVISFLFAETASEASKRSVTLSVYILTNLVTLISGIAYIIVKTTNLVTSPNPMISSSFTNVLCCGGRLSGITFNPNMLGPSCMLSCIMAVFYIKENLQNRKIVVLHTTLCIINLYLQFLTDCRASLVAALLVTIIFVLFSIKKHRKTILLISFFLFLVILVCLPFELNMLTKLTGRDWSTGSGRTLAFKEAFELIKQNPLFGYGTVSNYRQTAELENLNIIANLAGSHNLYIEIALLYGIPVLICFILSICITFWKVLKSYIQNEDMFISNLAQPCLIVMFILVTGLFEHHGLFRLTPPMFFLVFAFFSLRKNLIKSDKDHCHQ